MARQGIGALQGLLPFWTRTARSKLAALLVLTLLVVAAYLVIGVNTESARLVAFAAKIRVPKVLAIIIAGFAIGSASIVFQTIINNMVVTPCLLGMNALYTLIHTAVYFVAGSGSIFAVNSNVAFATDLAIMAVVATAVYSYLFKKTGYNVLYVLLVGTVFTSLFGSVQSTLVRVMDPNEYDSLLATLVASFSNVNAEIILAAVAALALVAVALRRDLAVLDVMALGKDQAVNFESITTARSAACCWAWCCSSPWRRPWWVPFRSWALLSPIWPGGSRGAFAMRASLLRRRCLALSCLPRASFWSSACLCTRCP